MSETTLRDAILAASEALDPQHQGDCWPDPIAWDGRPLARQARDLLILAREFGMRDTVRALEAAIGSAE